MEKYKILRELDRLGERLGKLKEKIQSGKEEIQNKDSAGAASRYKYQTLAELDHNYEEMLEISRDLSIYSDEYATDYFLIIIDPPNLEDDDAPTEFTVFKEGQWGEIMYKLVMKAQEKGGLLSKLENPED